MNNMAPPTKAAVTAFFVTKNTRWPILTAMLVTSSYDLTWYMWLVVCLA